MPEPVSRTVSFAYRPGGKASSVASSAPSSATALSMRQRPPFASRHGRWGEIEQHRPQMCRIDHGGAGLPRRDALDQHERPERPAQFRQKIRNSLADVHDGPAVRDAAC